MWSSMPNLSSVGPTVWAPIENRHTDSHLYYIDLGNVNYFPNNIEKTALPKSFKITFKAY